MSFIYCQVLGRIRISGEINFFQFYAEKSVNSLCQVSSLSCQVSCNVQNGVTLPNFGADTCDEVGTWMGHVALGISLSNDNDSNRSSVACVKAHGLYSSKYSQSKMLARFEILLFNFQNNNLPDLEPVVSNQQDSKNPLDWSKLFRTQI